MSDDAVDRYGVIGYPVSHSRSPVIHRLFAEQTGQKLRYELLQVPPDKLVAAIRQFQRTGGRGLNVTVPHKIAVLDLVGELGERARIAGAVNTLVFDDGKTIGDNTDGVGLTRDLTANQGIDPAGRRILILGAGGATAGILQPLLAASPARILIANRTAQRAAELARRFGTYGPVSGCGFSDVPPGQPFDLVINATSAGLGGETPPYPEHAVSEATVCYDLSYALKPTPFCAWAAARGAARSLMGWGMLVEQAAESFRIWRGVRPDTGPVLRHLTVGAR